MRRRALLASAFLLFGASACGGDSEPASEPAPPAQATTTEPAGGDDRSRDVDAGDDHGRDDDGGAGGCPGASRRPRLRRRLPRAGSKLNDAPIPPRDADPHNGTKNVYVSREQLANGRYPAGTIVVKDAVRPGTDFIGLIAIMRKEPGADPTHRNWVFAEYTRDARGEPFQEIASGAVCWSCHMGALDNDYVFTE